MHLRFIAALVAIPLVLGLLACGPVLLIPGGELEGGLVSPPADWSFSDETTTFQLETHPDDPYSVNIWAIGLGPALYVHAGANRSTWVEHMEANAAVRVRVEEKLYDLSASRVEEQEEFTRFSDAYEVKYGRRPGNENVAEAYLFRLKGPS